MSMVANRSKTSVDALAVSTPLPLERKIKRPVCCPMKKLSTFTGNGSVDLPSMRTSLAPTLKHWRGAGGPSRRTS